MKQDNFKFSLEKTLFSEKCRFPSLPIFPIKSAGSGMPIFPIKSAGSGKTVYMSAIYSYLVRFFSADFVSSLLDFIWQLVLF